MQNCTSRRLSKKLLVVSLAAATLFGGCSGRNLHRELFEDDQREVVQIVDQTLRPYFNRIGLVEILPSHFSSLNKHARSRYPNDRVVRLAEIKQKSQTLQVIKTLFGEVYAQY